MLRRPHYIALGLIVLLTLVTLNLPGHTTARLKLAIGSLFLPLFGLAGSPSRRPAPRATPSCPGANCCGRIEELRRENQQLRLQAMQAEETARENARLRQLAGLASQAPWKLKLARVVLRDPANWWRTVQIDLGSRDGLRVNLPVLTADGLVGRVSSVGLTRSQVMLLGDPELQGRRRWSRTRPATPASSAASGPLETELVELGYLSAQRQPQARASRGDQRRWGDLSRRAFPIGKIVDVRPVEYGSRTEARVKLAANLNALEEVWVMFP